MADVFISYHEKSAGEIVRQIADALEKEGITCWYAQRDLIGPGSFAAIIAREIRNCKVFLLVMNEESNQSEHVKNEIGVAFRRISEHEKMSLVLFRLDNCVLSDEVYYYVNRFQITNGNPSDKEHIKKLVKQISGILGYALSSSNDKVEQIFKKLTAQKISLTEAIKELQKIERYERDLCLIAQELAEAYHADWNNDLAKQLFKQVAIGQISPAEALQKLE